MNMAVSGAVGPVMPLMRARPILANSTLRSRAGTCRTERIYRAQ